jgi:formylglycine-generating enzyme required for sulfatase activity/predicted Ser/Thr protein kinase
MCGKQNRGTARYCNACGASLPWSPLESGHFLEEKRYEVEHLLKMGGMGSVYSVYDHRLKRRCALKELLDVYVKEKDRGYAVKRFETEATLLANLVHPHLPRVTDFFVENGRYFLIMDLIEGIDLLEYLEGAGPPGLPEQEVVHIALQALDVLRYLHSLRPPVIYRDLKPENLMITADRKVFLIDFGIARLHETIGGIKKTPIGTQGYASLEQAQGKTEPRSDLYSLGATMYHLLTGKAPTPFHFPPIRQENPHISKEMEAFLARTLKLLAVNRWTDAQAMRKALEDLARAKGWLEEKSHDLPHARAPSLTATQPAAPPSPEASTFVNPKDGTELVLVSEGEYVMGSTQNKEESPPHSIKLKQFYIARTPVTNEQFEEFVSQTGYKVEGVWKAHRAARMEQHPAVGIAWADARAYCAWAGLRLPTEGEWEAAARGPVGLPYPWGNEWEDNRCNWKGTTDPEILQMRAGDQIAIGTVPVGRIPAGASFCGVQDMLGNVWEWCSSLYRPYPWLETDGREDAAGSDERVLRGACWKSDRAVLRCSARKYYNPVILLLTVGFRGAL